MKHRVAIVGLSLVGCCLLALPASAADRAREPLQLTFLAPATAGARLPAQRRMTMAPALRAGRLVAARDQLPLRERALQSVLAGSELVAEEQADLTGTPENRFRFEKSGNVARDLSRGYRDMCAKVSNRVWDDPNGRRIKFDIAGKPGVAVEFPLR